MAEVKTEETTVQAKAPKAAAKPAKKVTPKAATAAKKPAKKIPAVEVKTKPSVKKTASTKSAKTAKPSEAKKDELDLLQHAIHLLQEAQKHSSTVKEEAREEVAKFVGKLRDSYQGIEMTLSVVQKEARKQAKEALSQMADKWHDAKKHLPRQLTSEVDTLLGKVGLAKKSKK